MAQKKRAKQQSVSITKRYVPREYSFMNNKDAPNAQMPSFSYEAANKYYQELHHIQSNTNRSVYNCSVAIRIARICVSHLSSQTYTHNTDGSLPEDCYNTLHSLVRNEISIHEVNDPELLLIYIKQTVHILRASDIGIHMQSTMATDQIETFYLQLLLSFWTKTDWQEIFPSDPDAAQELAGSKTILLDLLTNQKDKTELTSIANSFFELTGFAQRNDLFYISFLDFYLFTWLKHFGLINYSSESESSPVFIEITAEGRKLISLLNM